MAKQITSKKKSIKTKNRTASKSKKVTSSSTPNKDANLTEIKGVTAGEKGSEFHLKIGEKGKLAKKENPDVHLYVGSKGGDKHNVKS